MDTTTVLLVFIVIAVAAIATIVFLGNYKAREPLPQAVVSARGYAVRRYWLALTVVVAVAAFFITVPHFPYPSIAFATARHYQVVARQYAFALPDSVPLRTPVVFDVTSADVNHGFAIYSPAGKVIAQVQAMPDYTNHLDLVFNDPGRYTVRCFEYCGIAHAAMQAGFDVR